MHLSRILVALLLPAAMMAKIAGSSDGDRAFVPGKLYVAEAVGKGSVESDGRIIHPSQASVFDANGAILITEERSRSSYVLSNGTGLALDETTRLDLTAFQQDQFNWVVEDLSTEPSLSRSDARLAYGTIGVCTAQLVSGSLMRYATKDCSIRVPQRARLVINHSASGTRIFLLEGECTVTPTSESAPGGLVLHPGESALVLPGESSVQVLPMTKEESELADSRVAIACHARKSVLFTIDAAGAGKVSAHPVVPVDLPTNLVVSPSRIY